MTNIEVLLGEYMSWTKTVPLDNNTEKLKPKKKGNLLAGGGPECCKLKCHCSIFIPIPKNWERMQDISVEYCFSQMSSAKSKSRQEISPKNQIKNQSLKLIQSWEDAKKCRITRLLTISQELL